MRAHKRATACTWKGQPSPKEDCNTMSGQDFDFGLGDILQENDSGHTLARGGAGFLAVLFLLLSSITTFGFFSTYAADIGAWAGPTAAPLVSGVIGVLALDVASGSPPHAWGIPFDRQQYPICDNGPVRNHMCRYMRPVF